VSYMTTEFGNICRLLDDRIKSIYVVYDDKIRATCVVHDDIICQHMSFTRRQIQVNICRV